MYLILAVFFGMIAIYGMVTVPALGCLFGVIPSWMCYRAYQRKQRYILEERRHRELLDAVAAGKLKNDAGQP